jgi:hypothetical protein
MTFMVHADLLASLWVSGGVWSIGTDAYRLNTTPV